MVCIAAFIILCLLSLFVGILSIFRRDLGKKYWVMFKKSWGCIGKKITLQKCETGFKDDIKNSILKKVILKQPDLVKPISIGIEITAVLIVIITAWSLIEGVKAGLSLWSLGTCNPTQPSACTLGAEVCGIDQESPKNPVEYVGRWFTDWGEIFSAVPDKFRSWDATNFKLNGFYAKNFDDKKPTAIDVFDPGCVVCLQSFKNQQASNFFDDYNVLIVPYAIQNPDSTFKFKNSDLLSRYILAISERSPAHALTIIENIFTTYDENHIIYQNLFNEQYSELEASDKIFEWLEQAGYSSAEINNIAIDANSDQITKLLTANKDIVETQIHANGIPTMIYDNKKHTGLFK